MVYLKSIDRCWRRAIDKATGEVFVFSPYLTSRTADTVIGKASPTQCEVYTVFSIESFAARASSLKTLRKLHDLGYKLFHLENLHAKLVYVDDNFASIGSQNMTARGTKNLEASIAIRDPNQLFSIREGIETWRSNAVPITEKMLRDAEALIEPLSEQYAEFQSKADESEAAIFEQEVIREQRRQKRQVALKAKREADAIKAQEEYRQQLLRENASREQNKILQQIKDAYEPLTHYSGISQDFAKRIIRISCKWDHPCGRFVSAPEHQNHIFSSGKEWKIKLGANTFNISRAIVRCAKVILRNLSENNYDIERIKRDMRYNITCSVSRQNGSEYLSGYSKLKDGRIKFGTQAICTDSILIILDAHGQLTSYIKQLERIRDSKQSRYQAL